MVDELVRKLHKKQAEVEALRRQLQNEQRKRLGTLHQEFGFETVDELIVALRTARAGAQKNTARSGSRISKRARLTPAMKDQIKAALASGKKGAAVAREFGISYPTLHKLKTQLGLVKKRPTLKRSRAKQRS
jgi:hypothetical protein